MKSSFVGIIQMMSKCKINVVTLLDDDVVLATQGRYFLVDKAVIQHQTLNRIYSACELNPKTGDRLNDNRWLVKINEFSALDSAPAAATEYLFGSPHIPMLKPVYEENRSSKTSYLIIQQLGDLNLAQQLENTSHLSFETAFKIACSLLQSLHSIHKSSTVHRDLKPENIIMDAIGCAHIVDFGSACANNAVCPPEATARYMSPESRILKAKQTTAIDIFALTAILIQVFGGNPFVSKETFATNTTNAQLNDQYYQILYDVKPEELNIPAVTEPFTNNTFDVKPLVIRLLHTMQSHSAENRPSAATLLQFFTAWQQLIAPLDRKSTDNQSLYKQYLVTMILIAQNQHSHEKPSQILANPERYNALIDTAISSAATHLTNGAGAFKRHESTSTPDVNFDHLAFECHPS